MKGAVSGQILKVQLQETGTLNLYYQENTSVQENDQIAKILIAEWEAYHKKSASKTVRARETPCQTAPGYTMDKTTQKSMVTKKDNCSMVTQWTMFDEYNKRGIACKSSKVENLENGSEISKCSPNLLRGLGWIERQLSSSLNLNLLHTYTGFTSYKEDMDNGRTKSEGEGCRAVELWNFKFSHTNNMRVNQIVYCNSQWLVVAAYGDPNFKEHTPGSGGTGGMLCGWSAKRIAHPELRVNLNAAATVVSCCPSAPQLCCVALLDGTLHVYQLDTPTPILLLDTSGSVYKHCGPVWSVQWRITQPTNSSQTQDGPRQALVSASEDGTVKEWLLGTHGQFRCTTLMKVCLPPWASLEIVGGLSEILPESDEVGDDGEKIGEMEGTERTERRENTSRGGQLLPDSVPATSLKFRPGDSTSYLVGTVAGHLLVCRTFERRGSVAVFKGHRGLVSALDWRLNQQGEPATFFLSAALDDTIRVWHIDNSHPHCILYNPQASSGQTGYVDACWCPWYGNLVAGIHGGGLHLWDISVSTHTPALTHPVSAATCVAFSPHTRNVIVGDRNGGIRVIHLEGLTVSTSTAFHKFSSVLKRISMLGLKAEEEE